MRQVLLVDLKSFSGTSMYTTVALNRQLLLKEGITEVDY